MLPLFEAKMIHHFDHRFGTYEGQSEAQANQGKLPEPDDAWHANPQRTSLPRYWVDQNMVNERLDEVWDRQWLLGWRDITGSEKQRTVIASLVPRVAAGDTLLLAFPSVDTRLSSCLYANLCSFVLDYSSRQKVGGTHLKYYTFKQIPAPQPGFYVRDCPWERDRSVRDWLLPRVLELTYTAWDLQPFAEDCGDSGPPFVWDAERRFRLQCEIDAAFFHLYGIDRADADYILDTFPVLQRADRREFGEYRTKRVVLEVYDALADAAATGRPYVSPLGPPRRAT